MMDKPLVDNYFSSQHNLKLGAFFILSMLSLGVFIYPLGNFRYWFLSMLVFVVAIIIELVLYRQKYVEIREDQYVTGRVRIGRLSIFTMRNRDCGILFEGLMDGKAFIMKFYSMESNLEQTLENLGRYKYVEVNYYPKSQVIRDFHSCYQEG